MNIDFSPLTIPETGNIVFLFSENASLSNTAQQLDNQTQGALTRAIEIEQFSGKKNSLMNLTAPAHTQLNRIIVIGIGKGTELDIQQAGDTLVQSVERYQLSTIFVVADSDEQAAHFAYGLELSNYRFDKYRTRTELQASCILEQVSMLTAQPAQAKLLHQPLHAITQGVKITRDLVWEPANVIYPESFAQYCETLSDHGLEIEIVNSQKMSELGMGALLGVGQGSAHESLMVILKYQGAAADQAPVAFLGKGVTFDSGGLSLKPNSSMNTMKEDMGGAATVTGLMVTLAKRKANLNAIGVLGLVENMPSDKAQRPSDVVHSMSGQTIEVMNTDAEGRLVLCDLLTYTQRTFQPKAMFDLATLTGAVLVALGDEIAGIFSNDDQLAAQLTAAGEKEAEPVWRLPMGGQFDRLLSSEIADMRNNGNKLRIGGASVAAQFLARFIENGTPWVHIDIAGTAWAHEHLPNKPKGATGYGIRLLDRLIKEQFEA
ncbi:leucyl aminopeptidase [Celerinatantimonas yamalensis]|uniref:Probable cytosol aminopeptidase n=1 Tax=Celerinatantimonas yamalensis TaxID=559956 RepID=A0ABW9G7N9_9GAMM